MTPDKLLSLVDRYGAACQAYGRASGKHSVTLSTFDREGVELAAADAGKARGEILVALRQLGVIDAYR